MRRACVAALLFLAACAAERGAFAQGGPPLVTDDPGTPGPGNWEVNVAFTMDRTSASSVYGTPLVDANWGWGERIQLKLEIPWVVLSDADGTRNGVGNPLFGVKWRFLDESQAGISVSTYPQFGFNVVHSSVERGLVDEDPHFLLPISARKNLGPIEVNAEVGREFRSGGAGEWVWGLALGHEFHGFEALAEVFGTHGNTEESRQVLMNVGLRASIVPPVTLLASGGWTVSSGDGHRHAFVYVGIQIVRIKSKEATP